MTLSAALDSGLAFGVVVVFFGFLYPGWGWMERFSWWGTRVYKEVSGLRRGHPAFNYRGRLRGRGMYSDLCVCVARVAIGRLVLIRRWGRGSGLIRRRRRVGVGCCKWIWMRVLPF